MVLLCLCAGTEPRTRHCGTPPLSYDVTDKYNIFLTSNDVTRNKEFSLLYERNMDEQGEKIINPNFKCYAFKCLNLLNIQTQKYKYLHSLYIFLC